MGGIDWEWEQTYKKQLYRDLLGEVIRDRQSIDSPFVQQLVKQAGLTEQEVEEVVQNAKKPSHF